MDMVESSMLMGMPMKVHGLMAWHQDLGYTIIRMEHDMKVNGSIICRKEMAKSIGPTMLFLRGNTGEGKKMGLEHSTGVMELNILVNSLKIKYMGSANILGLTRENTRVIGKIIKWMDKGALVGKMEGRL